MPEVPAFVSTPRSLRGLSAIRYEFATARRADTDASARDTMLVLSFAGSYGVGSTGNGDAVFMRAVVGFALRAFAPAGVVLDLRGLDYRWGDMMATVLDDAIVYRVTPGVVVSDGCREAMTSLVAAELDEDPRVWLFDTPDEALRAVDARVRLARQAARQPMPAAADAAIQGGDLRAMMAAMEPFAQRGLDLERYRVEVARARGELVVSFIDRDAPPRRVRGNPGGIPGFEVALDPTSLQVMRAHFIR